MHEAEPPQKGGMGKFLYIVLAGMVFAAGVFVWRLNNIGSIISSALRDTLGLQGENQKTTEIDLDPAPPTVPAETPSSPKTSPIEGGAAPGAPAGKAATKASARTVPVGGASAVPAPPPAPSPPPGGAPAPSPAPATTSPPGPAPTPTSSPAASPSATPAGAPQHLVIASVQISATFSTNDFIKIFNPTTGDIDASGWKLRKRVSTGTEYSIRVFPAGSVIKPQNYFVWANSTSSFSVSIGANITSTETLAADNSIALENSSGTIIDKLAWGAGTNQFIEGTAYPVNPGVNQVLSRKFASGAIMDTDNNAHDFSIQ